MEPVTTRDEAREAIREALLTWQAEGVSNPAIPAYSDLDGDNTPDYWCLNSFGEVAVLSGEDLEGYTNVEDIDLPEDPMELQGP